MAGLVDGVGYAAYVLPMPHWLPARLLQKAWSETLAWCRQQGVLLEIFVFLGTTFIALLSYGSKGISSQLLYPAAAVLLLVLIAFVRNLVRAPEQLRLERIQPASFVVRVDTGPSDSLQQEAVGLIKAVEKYRPSRGLIGHGPVNDDLADDALRELNSRIAAFGEFVARATLEDGRRRRRRAARLLHERMGVITHESDLDKVRGEIHEFMRRR